MSTETVLVTGASSGIGLELARLFAADGSNLVLVARREERLRELADELIQRHSIQVHVLSEDLSDTQSPPRIAQWAKDQSLEIDVLVNNAGFGDVGSVWELPLDRQLNMVRVNVLALTHLTRLLVPGMIERRRGGVLNVGSTAAFQPGANMAVYFATKAYVLSFTEALAEEVGSGGVRVSCLCPGPTETEFGEESGVDQTRLFSLGTMTAAAVAVAGHRGFRRGKVVVVPGFFNKLGIFSVRFAPRWLARKFAKRLTAKV